MSSHSGRTAGTAMFASYLLLMLIQLMLFILLMCLLVWPLVRPQFEPSQPASAQMAGTVPSLPLSSVVSMPSC